MRTGALFRRILRYQCTVYTNNHSDVRSGMSAVSHLAHDLAMDLARQLHTPAGAFDLHLGFDS